MSATPILDCEVPLPTRPPVRIEASVVSVAALFVISTAATFAFLFFGGPQVAERLLAAAISFLVSDWTVWRLLLVLASTLAAYMVMMAVHELGHAIGGRSVGFAIQAVRVGPFHFGKGPTLTMDWRFTSFFTGMTFTTPVGTHQLERRAFVMVAAGPLANLLSGGLLLLLPFPKGVFWTVFVAASILNGLAELIPLRSAIGWSDGKILSNLLLRSAWSERWLALVRLRADVLNRTPMEDLSPDLLAKAVAIRDASADTVTAHSLAYAQAYHRNDVDRAAHMLEVCLAHVYCVPALREALLTDAAAFLAEKRKKPELARRWLQILGPATARWHILRVEASILQAEGKLEAAVETLKDCEAAANALPPDQRTVALGVVVPWRTRLEGWIEYLGPPEA